MRGPGLLVAPALIHDYFLAPSNFDELEIQQAGDSARRARSPFTCITLRWDLSRVRVLHAAVDVEDVARAPRRTCLRGEVEHGLGDVLGQHVHLQDVALAVVVFEFVRLYTVGGGALLT